MIFDNSNIRRKDRCLNEENSIKLLKSGEYGVLSLYDSSHGVYGIPISYVWDNKSSLYLHCAPEGKKLKIIENNNNASFCVVGKTNVVSEQFTTEYESIILSGKIHKTSSEEENMKALVLILEKFCPKDKEIGIEYAKKSFNRTNVLRFDIDSISGKTKRLDIMLPKIK